MQRCFAGDTEDTLKRHGNHSSDKPAYLVCVCLDQYSFFNDPNDTSRLCEGDLSKKEECCLR